MNKLNYRILVIDDDEGVRDNFAAVLNPQNQSNAEIDDIAADLFDEDESSDAETAVPQQNVTFDVSFAINGKQGIEKVKQANAASQPFAAIFCDMRMPGMDGLQCIEGVRQIDRRCQVIFVTAFSDHSVSEIVNRVGADIGYFHKPFSHDELHQLATKLVIDWNRARELEDLMQALITLRGESQDMNRLLKHLIKELGSMLGTDSVGLIQIQDGKIHPRIVDGRLNNQDVLKSLIAEFPNKQSNKNEWVEQAEHLIMPINEFGYAIALGKDTKLTPDKQYLVQLFLEQASLAIVNSEFRSKLMKAQKMSALGLAASQILHDMRNPIGSAKVLLDMIKQENYAFFDKNTLFEQVSNLLDRATALAEDTMDFSKDQIKLDTKKTDLGQLLNDEAKLWLQWLTPKDIELSINIDPNQHYTAVADSSRLVRVLENIVRNAADALISTPDPAITVTVKHNTDNDPEILITDNGPGIPERIKNKLFETFATEGKAQGTGLGLSIAKKIIDAHGGSITVESGSSDTTFIITFHDKMPTEQNESQKSVTPLSTKSPLAPLDGLRVLVIEDEFINQQIAQHKLEILGAKVTLADSAAQADSCLKQQTFDLLLVDIEMPDETGIEFIKRIRSNEKTQTIPALALTGYSRSEKEQELIACGFDQMLHKPIDAEELVRLVQN